MEKHLFFYQYISAVAALLSVVYAGFHEAWSIPSLPQLVRGDNEMGPQSWDVVVWIGVILYAGNIVGGITSTIITDKIGRKKTILYAAIPSFVGWLAIAFSTSAASFCIARFIAGISGGLLYTAIPSYIGEISDPKIRGLMGLGFSLSIQSGFLLMDLIGSFTSIKISAGVGLGFTVLAFLAFYTMPKSPYFLIMRNDFTKARDVLLKLGTSNVDERMEEIKECVKFQRQNKAKFLDLFKSKCNRRSLLVIWILVNASQLSGGPAIGFYNQRIFTSFSLISPVTASLIYIFLNIVSLFLTSFIVNKIRRKHLLVSSLVGCSCITLTLGTLIYLKSSGHITSDSINYVNIVLLFIFVLFYNFGCSFMPILMLSEICPLNLKVFLALVGQIYFVCMAMVVDRLFQTVVKHFGIHVAFYAFFVLSCCNLLMVHFFVPETKGKSLEEIQDLLQE